MLTSKIKANLVVARHNEKIDWIKNIYKFFSSVTICDKGKENNNKISDFNFVKIPNFGRECHSYLHYVITNYTKLDEYTHIVFCQANPFDHVKDFLVQVIKPKNYDVNPFYFNHIGNHDINFYYEPMERIHPIGLPVYNFYYHLFCDTYMLKMPQSRNSMMIIPVKNILFRSVNFYKYLLQYLQKFKNPLEGHIFERLWIPIFDGTTKDWISHYYSQRQKFLGEWNGMKID